MGMFEGKKGLVFGIANDHSIAWAITQKLHAEGAEMGFTHLPDKDPERPAWNAGCESSSSRWAPN